MEEAAESKSIGSGSSGMSLVPLFLEEVITAREREPEESGWAEQGVLVSPGWLGLPGKSPGHPSGNLCHF